MAFQSTSGHRDEALGVRDSKLLSFSALKESCEKVLTHYATQRYTALHCATLRCTTLRYTAPHYGTLHYTTLHYAALRYSTLPPRRTCARDTLSRPAEPSRQALQSQPVCRPPFQPLSLCISPLTTCCATLSHNLLSQLLLRPPQDPRHDFC